MPRLVRGKPSGSGLSPRYEAFESPSDHESQTRPRRVLTECQRADRVYVLKHLTDLARGRSRQRRSNPTELVGRMRTGNGPRNRVQFGLARRFRPPWPPGPCWSFGSIRGASLLVQRWRGASFAPGAQALVSRSVRRTRVSASGGWTTECQVPAREPGTQVISGAGRRRLRKRLSASSRFQHLSAGPPVPPTARGYESGPRFRQDSDLGVRSFSSSRDGWTGRSGPPCPPGYRATDSAVGNNDPRQGRPGWDWADTDVRPYGCRFPG